MRMGTSIINIDMMIINEDHPHAYGDKLSEFHFVKH